MARVPNTAPAPGLFEPFGWESSADLRLMVGGDDGKPGADFTLLKHLYCSLPKPRSLGLLLPSQPIPSKGAPSCPCPGGPESGLRVVVRTQPFSTHSLKEPGQSSQALFSFLRPPGQGEADEFQTRTEGVQSLNTGAAWGRQGRFPTPKLSLEIAAQPRGQQPGRGRVSKGPTMLVLMGRETEPP